jgi:hypothetical protein
MSSFPKATILRPLEVGQHVVIDVSQVPEFRRFYRSEVTDVDFKLIQILNIEEKTFYVVHDGNHVFSIEIDMPDTNAKAIGFLDDEF